jgi:hypothetical protein
MTLRLGGDGAITGCTSLENPDLTVSGLTISGSFDAEKVLVASGTAAAPSYTFSGDTDNGLYYAGTNSIGLATAGTNVILIDSSGRVGVGTDSPSADLHVKGPNFVTLNLETTGSSTNQLLFTRNNTTEAIVGHASGDNSFSLQNQLSGPLLFATNATERMRIDSAGNVGIGTTSPDRSLHIANTVPAIRFEDTDTSNALLTISGSAGDCRIQVDATSAYASSRFSVDIDGTERARIDSSGRLLVGTSTSPFNSVRDRLVVESAAGGNVAGAFKNYGGAGAQVADFWNATTTGDAAFINFLTETSITSRGNIDYNRTAGQVRYNVTSDRRLKSNIQDSGSAIGVVEQIKVRSYTWTETGYQVPFGFIAQELNKIAPDAVKVGDDQEEITDTWSVDNSKLVPLLTAALQEALAKIETLEQRLSDAGIA